MQSVGESAIYEDMEQNTATSLMSEATNPASPAESSPARRYSLLPAPEKTRILIDWLEENKARDIVALDVADNSPCMDIVIVVTASSLRHGQSLADGLLGACSERRFEYLSMEGYQTAQWILVDLNDIVVHIFQPEMRKLFRLEALWKQAPVLYGTVPDFDRSSLTDEEG